MVSFNSKWIKLPVQVVGAVAVLMLLDWMIPQSGSVLPSMLNLSWEKIKYIGIGLVILIVVVIAIMGYGIKKSEDKEFSG